VVHNKTEHTLQITAELLEKLVAAGHTIDQRNPELVISVGGDGTLLSAFHLYSHKLDHVRFIGVHTGHLGFYTDWRDYELDDLIELLSTRKDESVRYPLLDVRITYRNGKPTKHFLSLNESIVKRTDSTSAFVAMACPYRRQQDRQRIIKALEERSCIHESMPFSLPRLPH